MTSGVYAIQFPDHVKIGQSANLPVRLRGHAKAGAQRVYVLPVADPDQLYVEEVALEIATRIARRRGKREQFDDLPFERATAIVRAAVERYRRGATAWKGKLRVGRPREFEHGVAYEIKVEPLFAERLPRLERVS